MFKINKIINISILLLICFILIGCKDKTNEQSKEPTKEQEEFIDIKKINAELYNSNSSKRNSRRNTFNSIFSFENEDLDTHKHTYIDGVCSCGATDPNYVPPHVHEFVHGECECGEKDPDYIVEGLIPAGQYVVLFKSETEIQFTITLDNPKAESIDAIELTCDDPKSQILMDGKYENIQYSEDKTIIVNWSQENPYKKTYQIKTTSEETIQTLKVVDIKVNGEWQNKELSNDELKIYKIENNDIAVFTVDNTIEEYSFKVLSCSNVKSYDVIFNDRYIEADETGTYRVNEDGKIRIRYVYDFNGYEAEWEIEKEIELMKFNFDQGEFVGSIAGLDCLSDCRVLLTFTGTDINIDSIEIVFTQEKWGEKALTRTLNFEYGFVYSSNYCYGDYDILRNIFGYTYMGEEFKLDATTSVGIIFNVNGNNMMKTHSYELYITTNLLYIVKLMK